MKLFVIHGPNLNLLGTREQEIYGTTTLGQIDTAIQQEAISLGLDIVLFQSNSEGAIVDKIHSMAPNDVLVINAAAYTHTSVAIRDAIAGKHIRAIEVHLSNIHKREEFRHKSLIAPVCVGQICGFGINSYLLAVAEAARLLKSGQY